MLQSACACFFKNKPPLKLVIGRPTFGGVCFPSHPRRLSAHPSRPPLFVRPWYMPSAYINLNPGKANVEPLGTGGRDGENTTGRVRRGLASQDKQGRGKKTKGMGGERGGRQLCLHHRPGPI